MSNQLVIQGKALAISNYGGAVNDKGTLVGVRMFVAGQVGITKDEVEGLSFKEVKALVKAQGKTDAEIKAFEKDYDAHRKVHGKDSRSLTALLVADPAFRASLKINRNANGDTIGATTVFRKERSPRMTLENENAALKARIAALEGAKALPA